MISCAINHTLDRLIVHLVGWRCEQFNPRTCSTDRFLEALGMVMLAETQRRNRITGSWKRELDAKDAAFAYQQLAAVARERFEALTGSAGLQ